MRIERRYTKEGQSPYAEIEFRLTLSEIRNPDGTNALVEAEAPSNQKGRGRNNPAPGPSDTKSRASNRATADV
jgi:hypothetical protein